MVNRSNESRGPTTLATIASELDLSIATISCVLSGRAKEMKIAARTVLRVEEAARRLNYVRNEMARSLRRQRSGIIGVIFGNLYHGWAQSVLEGMLSVFDPRGYVPFMTIHNYDTEREGPEIRSLMQRQAEGIISQPLSGSEATYAQVAERRLPLVLLGDTLESMPDVSFVGWDSGPAARIVVQHLIDTGRRRIGFVGFVYPTRMTQARFKAYQAALHEAGLPVREEWIAWEPLNWSPDSGIERALKRIFRPGREHPDAIYFLNDGLALPGLSVMEDMGLRVPEDVAVVGMGDNPGAEHSRIGLTTIREPVHEMGRQAAEVILGMIDSPGEAPAFRTVPGNELVVRTTT